MPLSKTTKDILRTITVGLSIPALLGIGGLINKALYATPREQIASLASAIAEEGKKRECDIRALLDSREEAIEKLQKQINARFDKSDAAFIDFQKEIRACIYNLMSDKKPSSQPFWANPGHLGAPPEDSR